MKLPILFACGLALFASELTLAGVNDNPSDRDSFFDISVNKAFIRYDLKVGDIVDLSRCQKTDSHQEHGLNYETFNCAWELANELGGAPVRDRVTIQTVNGSQTPFMDSQAPVAIIETVIPDDRLEKADFIGFSLSSQGGGTVSYVAKGDSGQTREIGRVTLKDGRIGVIHRWVTPFISTGSDGQCTIRNLPFKPFFSTVDNSGNQTRYWDRALGEGLFSDYFLTNYKYPQGCVPGFDSIDQSGRYIQ